MPYVPPTPKPPPGETPKPSGLGWIWPALKTLIDGYCWHGCGNPNHNGLDIDAAMGDNILSPINGTISFAGWNNSGYGNLVKVRNGDYEVYLAHLSQINVREGQNVQAGKIVGLAGSTGRSTGPHLHFEIRFKGTPINPATIYGDISKVKPGRAYEGQPKPVPSPGTPGSEPGGNITINTPFGDFTVRDPFAGLISIWENIKWKNVAFATGGAVIIGIGLYGLVQGELVQRAVGTVVKSAAGGISEVVKE